MHTNPAPTTYISEDYKYVPYHIFKNFKDEF